MGELPAVRGVQLHGVQLGDGAVGVRIGVPCAGKGAGLDGEHAYVDVHRSTKRVPPGNQPWAQVWCAVSIASAVVPMPPMPVTAQMRRGHAAAPVGYRVPGGGVGGPTPPYDR